MKLKGSRILVTGGAGFLGGAMVEDLLRQGVEVDVIDNLTVGSLDSIPNGVSDFVGGNVSEENLDLLNKQDYDMVFHFAAPCTVLMFDKDPMKLYMNAISSAYHIRKFCSERNIRYLAYASSATYYGRTSHKWVKPTPFSSFPIGGGWTGGLATNPDVKPKTRHAYQEDMPPRPANIYGCTKTAEENLDTLFHDVQSLGLRYFPVYGPREYMKGDVASVPYKFSEEIFNGISPVIWGDGTQNRDYIYIDDATYCVRTLIERDAHGYYNIGTGVTTLMLDLIRYINQHFGTNIEPVYTENPYKDSYLNKLISDPTKMLDVIGQYKFTSIEEGIKMICKSIIENKE